MKLLHAETLPSRYLLASAACLLTTLAALPLKAVLDLANIVMLFLLAVFLIARFLGRGPAVVAAFMAVALFDFFFVPPQLSFTVADAQYLVTFAVMLAVGLVTASITAGMGEQTLLAQRREQEARALYDVAKALAGARTLGEVAEISRDFLDQAHRLRSTLFLIHADGELKTVLLPDHRHGAIETGFIRTVIDRGETLEIDTLAGSGMAALYFPLRTALTVRGVLAVSPLDDDEDALHAKRPLLGTLSSLMAIAVERLHYVEVAQDTQVQVASERLRNSILSSLSHDLRTPLTALVGLADSLVLAKPPLPAPERDVAQSLADQARAMGRLLTNLLHMARLQAERVELHRAWQPLEEVVGAALRLLGSALDRHPVRLHLPPDLPLVNFDAVLIERVFCNLLENAGKYAPLDTPIDIGAATGDGWLVVTVQDRGPGFPPGREAEAFNLFSRGDRESATPGMGLGLAICKAVVEAHGGEIVALPREGGGASVRFTLPLGVPPAIEEER